ncbi:PAS domain S-box protein [Undibacterium cyanobacteriorum]|uniref:PAS domain S-box protein n=1 Tax=Undibacterium cyanobacteriorum TaxID=3073561 RepID=A0ABY9RI93_9BURK|nr:PAS domain S-box protein [Undibacterium sp. 20NA77.5]WMW80563.1 PAS domain S-box protein [Undibacterium sp. 20NA77.5]
MVMISTLKGFFFVAITAALFYFALHSVPDHESLGSGALLSTLGDGAKRLHQSTWLIYVLGVVMSLTTLALHQNFIVSSYGKPMLIVFVFPVVLSAMLGGMWPALLACFGSLLGVFFLMRLKGSGLDLTNPYDLVQVISFLMICGTAILLSELLRRSMAKDELQRRLLDSVVSGTSDAIFVKDEKGRYVLANQAACNYVGRTEKEILRRTDFELFPRESAQLLAERDREVIVRGGTSTHEEALRMADGKNLIFSVTKGVLLDENGRACGLFGISRDVTLTKQTIDLLQRSEEKLKEAQQIATLGNWEWDLHTNTQSWSEQTFHIFGLDPTTTALDFDKLEPSFTPEAWLNLKAAVDRCLQDGTPYVCDAQLRQLNGSLHWVMVRGQALMDKNGEVIKLYGTIQDISDRKLIELRLKENEERLQLAIDATCDAIWDWDLRTNKVYRSPNYFLITDTRIEDHTEDFEFFARVIFEEDLAAAMYVVNQHKAGKTASIEFEFRLASSMGEGGENPRWLLAKGRTVARDEQGKPLRMVGTLSDITERRRITEDLKVVLEEAGDAIWITSKDREFIYANPSALRLLGYDLSELVKLQIMEVIAEEARPLLAEHLARLSQEKYIRRNWPMRHKDGRTIQVALSTERLADGRYMAFGRDLTEEQLAQAAIREREQRLARVLEGADEGYWDWNLKTNAFDVSPRWETMLGYQPGEMNVTPAMWPELIHPEDYPKAMESIRQHMAGEIVQHEFEMRCRTKGGDWRWIMTRGGIVERDCDGNPLMMSGTHSDITERKLLELAQKDALTVFSSSYEGIMVVNCEGKITKVNPAFSRITGFSASEVVGMSPKVLSSGRHDAAFYAHLWNEVNLKDFWRGEIWNRRKNGEVYAELLSISSVRDETGKVLHFIGVFSDISQIKAHEAELDRIAHYDILTGAPNRRLLGDRLGQAIKRAIRSETSLAVCFLDLDGFKIINDQYGHQVGDQLLVGVTRHLREVLRGNDTLARLGGDEFVVLLSDIGSSVECVQVLERILLAVSRPVEIDQLHLHTTASIGVSLFPDDNVDADSLLRHADQAMYMAKNSGKNRYHLFDLESDRRAQIHRNFLEALRQALVRNEFVLFYQPKVDFSDGRIIGAEALIRWNHPERGILAPGEFLSHVHGSNLEKELGEWVIETALSQGEEWHRQALDMRISVNVSADHILHQDFHSFLKGALSRHPDIHATHFELEVLETAAIADIDQAVGVLQRCHELGVKFALDDFGTGYSSLTYLRKLPIDTLKIDQCFVRNMLIDQEDLGIVEGVIRLANAFNREVIAEGVETLDHGRKLIQLGCSHAQGYGIARPMPAAQFFDWTQRWKREEAWLQLR